MEKLCLTGEQRLLLEAQTMEQNSRLWHQERRCRITGSKCGRILIQKKRTVALLRFCLYPRPLIYAPKAISWGRKKEPVARTAYIQHMKCHGHPNLKANTSGFYVHPEKGWLGASPDGKVCDPNSSSSGIAELKCPFSKADVSVQSACGDDNFYCDLTGDQGIRLNRNHQYYHQVQLQLYVSEAPWCDFCVWTSKDFAIERIYSDEAWQLEQIPKLDSYFRECILPEIVCPKAKPGYYIYKTADFKNKTTKNSLHLDSVHVIGRA